MICCSVWQAKSQEVTKETWCFVSKSISESLGWDKESSPSLKPPPPRRPPPVVHFLTFFKLIGKSLNIVKEKKQRLLTLISNMTLNLPYTIICDFKLDLESTLQYNMGVQRQPSEIDLHLCSLAARGGCRQNACHQIQSRSRTTSPTVFTACTIHKEFSSWKEPYSMSLYHILLHAITSVLCVCLVPPVKLQASPQQVLYLLLPSILCS